VQQEECNGEEQCAAGPTEWAGPAGDAENGEGRLGKILADTNYLDVAGQGRPLTLENLGEKDQQPCV